MARRQLILFMAWFVKVSDTSVPLCRDISILAASVLAMEWMMPSPMLFVGDRAACSGMPTPLSVMLSVYGDLFSACLEKDTCR